MIDGRVDRWIFGWGVLVGDVLFCSRYDLTLLLVFFSLSGPDIGHSPVATKRCFDCWGEVFDDRAADTTYLPHEHLRSRES